MLHDERWIEEAKTAPPSLDAEEERNAVARALDGDREALDLLLRAHVRRILRAVRPFPRDGHRGTVELVHVALSALWESLASWEPGRARLWTYALPAFVRPALMEAVGQEAAALPLSRGEFADHVTLRKAVRDVKNQGDAATVERLRRHPRLRGWSRKRIVGHLSLMAPAEPWDAPASDDGTPEGWGGQEEHSLSAADRVASSTFPVPGEELERQERHDAVQRALRHLTARQRRILHWSYALANGRPAEHLSTREQADRLDLTPQRVGQLRAEALATLRALPEDEASRLRDYWEAA